MKDGCRLNKYTKTTYVLHTQEVLGYRRDVDISRTFGVYM